MDQKNELVESIQEFITIDNDDDIMKKIIPSEITFLKLRDCLMLIGKILLEDKEKQIYVVNMKSGIANLSHVYVALQLNEGELTIISYAKEGFVNQRASNRAITRILNGLDVSKGQEKILKRNTIKKMVCVCIVAFLLVYLGMGIRYAKLAKEYNPLVKTTSIENIQGLPKQMNAWYKEIFSISMLNKIKAAEDGIKIMKQITKPSEKWVLDRLHLIEQSKSADIVNIQAVTKENDPNGLLNEKNAYISCIYFQAKSINPDSVEGKDTVAKGTDVGGAIEVYKTVKDAEARVDYLSGFDDTILYSGSYAIVGTMVIRTSYKLTNEQQLTLTNEIVHYFTALQ